MFSIDSFFYFLLKRGRGTPEVVPLDVIDRMTQGYKLIAAGVQDARGLSHFFSRKRTPRGVLNGIAGGSYAREDDLILVKLDRP